MLKKLAIAISVIMHPLLMPTVLFALLFFFAPSTIKPISQGAVYYIVSVIFITTFLLPTVSTVALRLSALMGGRKSAAFSLPKRQDRVLPFLFTSLFYGITAYMFFAKLRLNQVLVVILVCCTVVIAFMTIATFFQKVSAYGGSIGALIGFLISLGKKYPQENLLWPLLVLIILGGLTMSARLYLEEHKPAEVLTGFLIGLLTSLVAIFVFIP